MTVSIVPERLERFLKDDIHLRQGAGDGANGEIDVCVMQAVDWLAGGNGKTDSPSCASRVIKAFCIRLNDSDLFAGHRDLLKPYAARIVGTHASDAIEIQRGFVAADFTFHAAGPLWLRALGESVNEDLRSKFEDWAARLEGVAPIRDSASANAARSIANEVLSLARAAWRDAASAAYAADAAYAASAASAASAAYAASAASAASAAYAADAASAAYAADAAYAARKRVIASHGDLIRAKALECLDALIAVGAEVA